MKSTIREIEERFDKDVERFANLDTGQQTTLDARFNMEIITEAIARRYPRLKSVLDIGCGAGNYTVKLLQKASPMDITLVDLSQNMLNRAVERVQKATSGKVTAIKGDFRQIELPSGGYDVVITTAVLHHLRDGRDWEECFAKLYRLLRKSGSIWIFDLVYQCDELLQRYLYHDLYGEYLVSLKDEAYRDDVFAYIDKEDTPRDLLYQLDLLRSVGFQKVDVLHKNLCFASFVGFK